MGSGTIAPEENCCNPKLTLTLTGRQFSYGEIVRIPKNTVLIKKRYIKGEKHITPMDFAEHLRKSDVSEKRKVYYGRFLRNGLHERYWYISKSK